MRKRIRESEGPETHGKKRPNMCSIVPQLGLKREPSHAFFLAALGTRLRNRQEDGIGGAGEVEEGLPGQLRNRGIGMAQQANQHAHPWKFVRAKTYHRHFLRHSKTSLSLFLFGIRANLLMVARDYPALTDK